MPPLNDNESQDGSFDYSSNEEYEVASTDDEDEEDDSDDVRLVVETF